MTAANPSAMVEGRAVVRSSRPAVEIAGARWPLYKVHALLAALIVAMFTVVVTGSGQAAAWASAVALVVVWWTERLLSGGRPR